MNIEEGLSETNLQVLSNFITKFRQDHQQDNLENYAIRYSGARDNGISNINVYMSTTYTINGNYYKLQNTLYSCTMKLNQFGNNGNEAITWENFDYQTISGNCESGGSFDFLIDLSTATGSSRYVASNLYQNNYLDIQRYQTIEEAPSPSPEPEEPSGETTDYTNWFILLSAILMLLIMYRFIGSLFSRGD